MLRSALREFEFELVFLAGREPDQRVFEAGERAACAEFHRLRPPVAALEPLTVDTSFEIDHHDVPERAQCALGLGVQLRVRAA